MSYVTKSLLRSGMTLTWISCTVRSKVDDNSVRVNRTRVTTAFLTSNYGSGVSFRVPVVTFEGAQAYPKFFNNLLH